METKITNEIFKEMKEAAISLWTNQNPPPTYLKEKLERINSVVDKNDYMVFYNMLDWRKKALYTCSLSKEACNFLNK